MSETSWMEGPKGLLEVLFGKVEGPEPKPDLPDAVTADEVPGAVCATVSGEVIEREVLPDPIFASGAMGPALGIKPDAGVLYSPVSGTVTITTRTLHAIAVESDEGVEVLIHIGVDTVNMRGDGFVGLVSKGEHVTAGQPLMLFDLDRIARAGYSDVVIMVVANASTFASVRIVAADRVVAGERLMMVDLP